MEDMDSSAREMRIQFFESLKCTGKLDALKSQLRARLLDHLRDRDGTLLEFKGTKKPSVTERILSSLFLDYLSAHGYSFTQSVFLPESQATSLSPFTFKEMLQLLHLDPMAPFHHGLRIVGKAKQHLIWQLDDLLEQALDSKSCLAQQLVMVLQKMPPSIQDSCSQTKHSGPEDLESCLRKIDESCSQKKDAERQLAFRTLEQRLSTLREEFETRVKAEVALQIKHIREYETNAVRLEEEGRYRRRLARDHKEFEGLHKTRQERIRAREEKIIERQLKKEKVIEASAYEQRQKLLTSFMALRDREEKLKEKENLQERLEETLKEKERDLKLKVQDVSQRTVTLHREAEDNAQMRLHRMADQYKSYQQQLQLYRDLLEVERLTSKENKSLGENELAAAEVDKGQINSLQEGFASEGKQQMELVNSLVERLASEEEQRKQFLNRTEYLEEHPVWSSAHLVKMSVQDKRYRLPGDDRLYVKAIREEGRMGNGCKYSQHQKWPKDQTKLQETIKQLNEACKEALNGIEQASRGRKSIQLQLKSSESQLLDTVTLLKKTQHALELERLHHYSLRSQIASYFSMSSQAVPQGGSTLMYLGGISKNECYHGPGPAEENLAPSKHLDRELEENEGYMSSQLSPSEDTLPCMLQKGLHVIGSCPNSRRRMKIQNTMNVADSGQEQEYMYTTCGESGANPNSVGEQEVGDAVLPNVPVQRDVLEVVKGAKEDCIPYDKRKELPGEAFSSCLTGHHNKNPSERRSNSNVSSQGHPAKGGDHGITCSTGDGMSVKTSGGHVQRRPLFQSIKSTHHEGKSGYSSVTAEDTGQSSMNYNILGASSCKSSGSALETEKDVNHPSHMEKQTADKGIQTQMIFFAMKFPKHFEGSKSKDSTTCPSDTHQFGSQMNPECQYGGKESTGDLVGKAIQPDISRLSERTNSVMDRRSMSVDLILEDTPEQRDGLDAERAQLQMKELQIDETLQILQYASSHDGDPGQSQAEPCTLDGDGQVPLSNESNQEESTTNRPLGRSPSTSPWSTERVDKKYNIGSSKASPVSLRSDIMPQLANKGLILIDSEGPAQSINRQQTEGIACGQSSIQIDRQKQRQVMIHSFKNLKDEDSRNTNSSQPSKVISLALRNQCDQTSLLSCSQVSGSGRSDSMSKADIWGRAYSEESCNNCTRRVPNAKSDFEITILEEMSEATGLQDLCLGSFQQGESGLGSEQGSYSPSEENAQMTEESANADDSDVSIQEGELVIRKPLI